MRIFCFVSILICQFFSSYGQDWAPIPYGQTSYFETLDESSELLAFGGWIQSNKIFSAHCDTIILDSIGSMHGIYRKHLELEFDSCAKFIDNRFGVRGQSQYVNIDGYYRFSDTIILIGPWGIGCIDLGKSQGQLFAFNENLNFKLSTITESNLFGEIDSIREYQILSDSITTIGSLHLSKSHGLVQISDVNSMSTNGWPNFGDIRLVGWDTQSEAKGYSHPDGADFFPYQVGYMMVFHKVYQGLSSSEYYEEYDRYTVLNIELEATTTLSASLLRENFDVLSEPTGFVDTVTWFNPLIDFNVPLNVTNRAFKQRTLFVDSTSGNYWYQTRFENPEFEEENCFISEWTPYYDERITHSTIHGYEGRRSGGLSFSGDSYSNNYLLIFRDFQGVKFGSNPLPFDTVTGAENVLESSFKVYPNPASDLVHFTAHNISSNRVDIIDAAGRVLDSKLISNSNGSIDISTLNDGIYFLKVSSDDGSEVRSFVKSSMK